MSVNKNWNHIQKYYDVYDSNNQPVNKIGYRRISIENSTNKVLGICIYHSLSGGYPRPDIFLKPGEIIHRAVNSPGSPLQYLRIFGFSRERDEFSNSSLKFTEIGEPSVLQSTYNQFVIREGTAGIGPNHIFVHAYYQAAYRA